MSSSICLDTHILLSHLDKGHLKALLAYDLKRRNDFLKFPWGSSINAFTWGTHASEGMRASHTLPRTLARVGTPRGGCKPLRFLLHLLINTSSSFIKCDFVQVFTL